MGVSKIWVFAEADGDKPTSATLEILTKARELADTVEAVYVGTDADAQAGGLGEHGATKVFAVDPGDALPGIVGAAAPTTPGSASPGSTANTLVAPCSPRPPASASASVPT